MPVYVAIVQNKETGEPTQILIRGEEQLRSFFRSFNPITEALGSIQFVGQVTEFEDYINKDPDLELG